MRLLSEIFKDYCNAILTDRNTTAISNSSKSKLAYFNPRRHFNLRVNTITYNHTPIRIGYCSIIRGDTAFEVRIDRDLKTGFTVSFESYSDGIYSCTIVSGSNNVRKVLYTNSYTHSRIFCGIIGDSNVYANDSSLINSVYDVLNYSSCKLYEYHSILGNYMPAADIKCLLGMDDKELSTDGKIDFAVYNSKCNHYCAKVNLPVSNPGSMLYTDTSAIPNAFKSDPNSRGFDILINEYPTLSKILKDPVYFGPDTVDVLRDCYDSSALFEFRDGLEIYKIL